MQARYYLVANLQGDLREKLGIVCPVLERIPIFRNPITRALSDPSIRRKLKGIGADLNSLIRAEPAGWARLSPPADARATAQVYAEDPPAELLQVGMPPADLS